MMRAHGSKMPKPPTGALGVVVRSTLKLMAFINRVRPPSHIVGEQPTTSYLAMDTLMRFAGVMQPTLRPGSSAFSAWMAILVNRASVGPLEKAVSGDSSPASVASCTLGGVPCVVVDPEGVDTSANGVVLHFHGGAYVLGAAAPEAGYLARVAEATDRRVISVDYRLAPEYPLPAATDDVTVVYEWCLHEEKVPASRISLLGQSAGGGLVLLLLQRLAARGEPLPASATLVSAFADMSLSGETFEGNKGVDAMEGAFVNSGFFQLCTQCATGARGPDYKLTGAAPDLADPQFSPLNGEFRGLPRLLVMCGSTDVLLSDSRRIYERAKAAGVDVELEVAPNMCHNYPYFTGVCTEATEAVGRIASFVVKSS